ncbi:enterochelin esterase [Kribbella turkmenica]|uniref:Enterochelin esterase n=1 Tax=Kribbella turkmenica TaxID=2530375 RepID=A0A4R4WY00_9ACTN|nr:enterochelin esterase [Kribbella turkmenica]TDD22645.1 enterochelin esterase [Kribbella turkmenica]
MVVSPRIEQLRRDLADGPVGGVLARFWAEVALVGTPLVEPYDDECRLVTFVWKQDQPVERVVVIGGPALWWEIPDNQLERLDGTNVWFRTYLVGADHRGRYVLSPDDSLQPLAAAGTPAAVERAAAFRPDPFNRTPFTLPGIENDPGSPPQYFSTFALDQATPRCFAEPRPDVPRGAVREAMFASEVLGNERKVWLWESAVDTSEPALLVLLDGRDWTEVLPIFPTLDNLVAEGLLPPMVAVLPDSIDFATRARELPCHEGFAHFLAEELLPWARRRTGATADPRRIVVAGKSYGGLASVFAGLRRPDVFGNVIAQSGSFWWSPPDDEAGWLIRQVDQRVPVRFCLDVGQQEGDWMIPQTKRLAAALGQYADEVLYREYNGGHDLNCWLAELPVELRWALEP